VGGQAVQVEAGIALQLIDRSCKVIGAYQADAVVEDQGLIQLQEVAVKQPQSALDRVQAAARARANAARAGWRRKGLEIGHGFRPSFRIDWDATGGQVLRSLGSEPDLLYLSIFIVFIEE